jgi:signal transduction histidine kinase
VDEAHSSGPADEPGANDASGQGGEEHETELTGTARALLHAFVSISSDLDTRSVLHRIVSSACELTRARCGALLVLGHDGRLADMVSHGLSPEELECVGGMLVGEGLLDVSLIGHDVVRVDDLHALLESAGHSADLPPMRTLLMAPIRVRGTAFGQLYLTEKAGGAVFDKHDEMLVQSLASVAGIVIENSRAYGVSERRRSWLETFGRLSELLMPPISLETALERVAAALLEASGAVSSSVIQVPEDGTPFPAVVYGSPPKLGAEDERLLADAVRSVVESEDLLEVVTSDDWVAVLAPLRAHLTVPGVLLLTHPRLGRPDALEERELLSSFAEQAGLALDRTQALEDRERLAVIVDRDRIARDLHDVVIQRLFAMALHLQSIRAAAPTDELRGRIDQCVNDLDQTIRDIRGTIFELQTRPRSSLRNDVRDAVRAVVPQLGFLPSVETTGPVDTPIDAQLQSQLITVLREALTNVAQHARATTASVEMQLTDTHLRLRVTDDGIGIPDERTELGLRNVRRRAALLGGHLDLWPNDPSGTIFVWSVPLPSE